MKHKLLRISLWLQLNPKAWRLHWPWAATSGVIKIYCPFELGLIAPLIITEPSLAPAVAFDLQFIVGQREFEDRG